MLYEYISLCMFTRTGSCVWYFLIHSLVIRMSPSYYHWLLKLDTICILTSSYSSNNNSGMFMYPLSSTTNSDRILFFSLLILILWQISYGSCGVWDWLIIISQFHKTLYDKNTICFSDTIGLWFQKRSYKAVLYSDLVQWLECLWPMTLTYLIMGT